MCILHQFTVTLRMILSQDRVLVVWSTRWRMVHMNWISTGWFPATNNHHFARAPHLVTSRSFQKVHGTFPSLDLCKGIQDRVLRHHVALQFLSSPHREVVSGRMNHGSTSKYPMGKYGTQAKNIKKHQTLLVKIGKSENLLKPWLACIAPKNIKACSHCPDLAQLLITVLYAMMSASSCSCCIFDNSATDCCHCSPLPQALIAAL